MRRINKPTGAGLLGRRRREYFRMGQRPITIQKGNMEGPEIQNLVLHSLNDAVRRDPAAIHALICNRVPCNNDLAQHPYIQVIADPVSDVVGALGLINGILSLIGAGTIQAEWAEENGKNVFKGFGPHG